jgi:MFS family permease
MTTPVSGHVGPHVPADRPTHLQLLSFWMLGGFVVGMVLAIGLGTWLMHLLGVPEGELLTTAGFYGWLASLAVLTVMVIAPIIGIRYAVASQRLRPASATLVALILNAVALLYVLATTALSLFIPTT